MKTFIQSGTGSTATLQEANPSKIRVFDTYEDAEAAISSIKENEIVCIKEASDEQVRDATVPVGTIVSYLSDTIPDGWLLCDGSDIPEKYVRLRELIGTKTPVSINYPEFSPEAEDITSTIQSVHSQITSLKVTRVGNVINVDMLMNGPVPNPITFCYLPKPTAQVIVTLFAQNTSTTPHHGIVGTGVLATNGVFCQGYLTDLNWDNAYCHFTYITDEFDGTAHYNIIKAAPNQSEVQDIEMNMPVGSLISYRGQTTPVGFLRADGSTFDKDKYPLLYTALGNSNTLPVEIDYSNNQERTLSLGTVNTGEFGIVNTGLKKSEVLYLRTTGDLGSCQVELADFIDNDNLYIRAYYLGGQTVNSTKVPTLVTNVNIPNCTIHYINRKDAHYKYIKATSGIEAEEETIATAVNEAIKEYRPIARTASGTFSSVTWINAAQFGILSAGTYKIEWNATNVTNIAVQTGTANYLTSNAAAKFAIFTIPSGGSGTTVNLALYATATGAYSVSAAITKC